MIVVDPAKACTSSIYAHRGYEASGGRGSVNCCADAFAEGAILVQDLCPDCRRWLIAATDSLAGRRLPWRRDA
jgi:hypothetical protein